MVSVSGGITVSSVNVMTSDDGGHTTEQIVDMAMYKILMVADSAPPAIKDQVHAFQQELRKVLQHYMELARREERVTIARRLDKSNNTEIADLVRRI